MLTTDDASPTTPASDPFTDLSVRLTGFTAPELAATGLADACRAETADRLGPDLLARLLAARGTPPERLTGDLADAARALTLLWYTGGWPAPDAAPLSPASYAESLVWKAAGLVPPATAPQPYGSWSEPPAPLTGPPARGTGAGAGR
ncbi:hypothetical protein [Streptomyces sp. NPDC090025]|uniref:hypothetical protein n=1 Tax=Streptomyces sp. NPDC090025 TaxID=3365922 RepID=UPI0038335CDE